MIGGDITCRFSRKTREMPPRIGVEKFGIDVSLSYRHFGVWLNGQSLEIPVNSFRRTGRGWIATGSVTTNDGSWDVKDVLTPRGNTLVIDRKWHYQGKRLPSVRLGMDMDVPFSKLDFWAIPYISMNGNLGTRTVPSGMTYKGDPWVFREERTTAPGLMTLESAGIVAGTYTAPGRTEDRICACSIMPGERNFTLRTFFPFREGPRTFLGAAFPGNSSEPEQGLYTGGSGYGRGLAVESGSCFRRRFFVVLDQSREKRHGYARCWESAWRNLRDPIAGAVSLKRTEKLLWKSLDPFWFRKGKVRGYVLRIDRNGNKLAGFSPTLCTGWSGPTMMLTWLAMRRAIKSRDFTPAKNAILATEFFVNESPRKNGAFQTLFNVKTMTWEERSLNAVQLGGAAYWLLRCVDLARKSRLFDGRFDAEKWVDMALGGCELAVRTQRSDGAFGARFDADGRCLEYERAMGVHTARAVLEAYRHTGIEAYLQAVERGAEFYIRTIVARESGYGDCTDLLNSTTENDGAFMADFFIELYRVTRNRRYFDSAVRVAEFCLSFMFTYNVHFSAETECGKRRMRTRGFSAISPETGFVCFWFTMQGNAFLELWKETGDKRWKDYAIAIIRGSLQMIAKPGNTFGLAERMVGSRAEVIAVLDTIKGGHVWKKGMTGYTWHQPVWWPAAFNLLNFAVLQDSFPNVIKDMEA